MDEKELLLVCLVQARPNLYDNKHAAFKNLKTKETSWSEIATAMRMSVDDCQRLWRNFRERFNKQRKISSVTGIPAEQTWPLYARLQFLDKHIKHRRSATQYKRKSDDSSEAEKSARLGLDDSAVSQESDPLQNMCFIKEEIEVKPEMGDYEITSPSNPHHSPDIRVVMEDGTLKEVPTEHVEVPHAPLVPHIPVFETTVPITSSDKPAQIVHVPKRQKTSKTNQNSVDDKVFHAMEAVVDCLGNIYPETSIDAFGNFVASTLKDFPKVEMHKARQEIMEILAKYQELLDTQCKKKSNTPDVEISSKLDGNAVSHCEPFQSVFIKKEIEDRYFETTTSQKRPHSLIEEEEMLPGVRTEHVEPIESITIVPNTSIGNPAQIFDIPKRQKTKNNQNSVDDKVVNAMEAVVDCLRNIYPETSIDAFGNYVSCALKEFPNVKRHKARREIMGILAKYQELLNT